MEVSMWPRQNSWFSRQQVEKEDSLKNQSQDYSTGQKTTETKSQFKQPLVTQTHVVIKHNQPQHHMSCVDIQVAGDSRLTAA